MHVRPAFAAATAALVLLAACGPEKDHARLCERVARQIEGISEITVIGVDRPSSGSSVVTVRYRTGPNGARNSVTCRLAGGGLFGGPLRLIAVRRGDGTSIHRVSLGVLKSRLNVQ